VIGRGPADLGIKEQLVLQLTIIALLFLTMAFLWIVSCLAFISAAYGETLCV